MKLVSQPINTQSDLVLPDELLREEEELFSFRKK